MASSLWFGFFLVCGDFLFFISIIFFIFKLYYNETFAIYHGKQSEELLSSGLLRAEGTQLLMESMTVGFQF